MNAVVVGEESVAVINGFGREQMAWEEGSLVGFAESLFGFLPLGLDRARLGELAFGRRRMAWRPHSRKNYKQGDGHKDRQQESAVGGKCFPC